MEPPKKQHIEQGPPAAFRPTPTHVLELWNASDPSTRFFSRCAALLGLFLLFAPSPPFATAQQFVTDDAALVEYRAFQVEAWHGREASWLLPAFHLIPTLELTTGLGSVSEDDDRSVEFVLQGKYMIREVEPDGYGWGVVVGFGADQEEQSLGRPAQTTYAYVPFSTSVADDRFVLHANVGWSYNVDDDMHILTYGMRGDFQVGDRLMVIGEVFGDDRLGGKYQVGIGLALIPDCLQAELSYGGHTWIRDVGPGVVVRLAWTPSPVW